MTTTSRFSSFFAAAFLLVTPTRAGAPRQHRHDDRPRPARRNNPSLVAISEASVTSQQTSITLDGNPELDLTGYLKTNPDVGIEVIGDVPGTSWSATLDLCFAVD